MPFKKILYTFLGLGVFLTLTPSQAGWVPVHAQWQDDRADLTPSGHPREISKRQIMLVQDEGFTYDPSTETGGNKFVRVKTKGFQIRGGKGLLYWPRKKGGATRIHGSKYNAGVAFHAVNLTTETFMASLGRLADEKVTLYDPLRAKAWTVRERLVAKPVVVHINSFEELNAYYDPNDWTIHTGYRHLGDGTVFQVGLSSEVLAHEKWHHHVDVTRPDFLTETGCHTQAGGMHEGISDWGSVVTASEMQELAAYLMHKSGGDLNHPSFKMIGQVGEGFGSLFGESALRHVRDDVRMPGANVDMPEGTDFSLPKARAQVHDISRVFSGAQWDTMNDAFKYYSDQRLFRSLRIFLEVLFGTPWTSHWQD